MENVMNKNLRLLWAVALLVLGCSGTQNKSSHLNGPIMEYDSIPNERYVECTPLNIKDKHLCSGLMSVCDTLLIFAHPSWDMQLQVINLNTGLCVGEMCPTGRSHNTYSNARQFGQFVKENGEVKLWVHNRLKSLDLIIPISIFRLNSKVLLPTFMFRSLMKKANIIYTRPLPAK